MGRMAATSSRDDWVSGQRVLVSAAATGIGRAIAETLHRHGARVHACDLDEDACAAFRAACPGISIAPCDVSDADQAAAWVEDGIDRLGGLDGLVNNAGIGGPTGRIEEIAPADWRRTIEVDLNGMFYVTRRAVPALRTSRGGAVVNLSSLAGKFGFAGRTPYAAAKWAVVGFTKSLARELGEAGVRVNAIQPGNVEGPRIERVIDAKARLRGESPESLRARLCEVISLGRFVTAQDVADTALFLLSPLARNVSGQVLAVDGDTQMLL